MAAHGLRCSGVCQLLGHTRRYEHFLEWFSQQVVLGNGDEIPEDGVVLETAIALAMEVTPRIPEDVAKRLSDAGGDVSRRALEALALGAIATKLLVSIRFRKC